jgi:hypothetical protein
MRRQLRRSRHRDPSRASLKERRRNTVEQNLNAAELIGQVGGGLKPKIDRRGREGVDRKRIESSRRHGVAIAAEGIRDLVD